MASIFGSSQPRMISADGLTTVDFDHSKILIDRPEFDTLMNQSRLNGDRNFHQRGYHWLFKIRDYLFNYNHPDSKFESVMEYLGTEITLYAHRDAEPFSDTSGETVPFFFDSFERFYADDPDSGKSDYIEYTFKSTKFVSMYFPSFPVSRQLYRNEEQDNTLDIDDCTPITIESIDTTANTITLSWVPNVDSIFAPGVDPDGTTPGWALARCEFDALEKSGEAATADPARDGDYVDILLIESGIYSTRTLNYTWINRGGGSAEANWIVGDKVYLYNPYVGKWTWPTGVNPIVEKSGAGWRQKQVGSGGAFIDGSGDLILLINGWTSGTLVSTGAFKADNSDWDSFTVMNSDSAVIVAGGSDWRQDQIYSGHVIAITDPVYDFICYCTGTNGSKNEIGYVKFTEDLSSISYSTTEIVDSGAKTVGLMYPSVIYHNGKYRMIYVDKDDTATPDSTWAVREAFSQNPEGPFGIGDAIIPVYTGNEGSWRSGYCDSYFQFHYKNRLYMLTAGTAVYAASGTRGNRQIGLYYYNENLATPAWQEDKRSPIFINPIYGNDVWPNRNDNWASDHMGGQFPILEHPTNGRMYLFMSCNYAADAYSAGMLYLEIPTL